LFGYAPSANPLGEPHHFSHFLTMTICTLDSALHAGTTQDITLAEMALFTLMASVIFIETALSRLDSGNDFQFPPLSFAIDIDYFPQSNAQINRI
jgi:hypothetical protein